MFIGLMIGGVLADRYERKNSSCWRGYLRRGVCRVVSERHVAGAIINGDLCPGVVGWLFRIVRRDGAAGGYACAGGGENLMQAGAITMLTVRLGSVISPMVVVYCWQPVTWRGTTGWRRREPLSPRSRCCAYRFCHHAAQQREHPLKSLMAAIRFLFSNPLIGGIALLGGLLTMASAVRVLIRRWR
jgi:ENTS family enterobactin (siderophore) exporter